MLGKLAGCLVILILGAMFFTGCGSETQEAQETHEAAEQQVQPAQPVTLTILASSSEETLNTHMDLAAFRKKYPNITLKFELVNAQSKITFESAITSGVKPDLVCCSINRISELIDMGLLSDLTPLVNKHHFDLTQLKPGMEQVMRSYSDKGELTIMPYFLNNLALYYNKDIFDKFALPYPKDNMTWDEVYELSKKLTRTDGGVQYRGFQFNLINIIYKDQLGEGFVDPRTNKATVNTSQWKKWVETMSRFSLIEGNAPGNEQNLFLKDKTLAMRSGQTLLPFMPDAQKEGLNWDLASYPSFAGMTGIGTQMNAPFFAIPPTSQHKDEAFQFLEWALSEEQQTWTSGGGLVPVIRSAKAEKAFASRIPGTEGKNLHAFFMDTIAKPIPYTRYNSIAAQAMQVTLTSVQLGEQDVNTALRELEEQINKTIAEH